MIRNSWRKIWMTNYFKYFYQPATLEKENKAWKSRMVRSIFWFQLPEESVDSSEHDVSQMIVLRPPSLYLPRRSCATVILGSAFLSRQSCESHKVFFMWQPDLLRHIALRNIFYIHHHAIKKFPINILLQEFQLICRWWTISLFLMTIIGCSAMAILYNSKFWPFHAIFKYHNVFTDSTIDRSFERRYVLD